MMQLKESPSDLDKPLGLEELFDITNDTNTPVELPALHASRDQMVHDEVEAVFADTQAMQSPEIATAQLLKRLEFRIFEHNTDPDTGKRRRTEFCWQSISVLPPYAIARLASRFFHIRYIVTEDDASSGLLGIYEPKSGLYSTDQYYMRQIFVRFNKLLSARDEVRVLDFLPTFVPRVVEDSCRHAVPVKNGVFDLETKTLSAFTPERVFLSKIDIAVPKVEPEMPVFDDGRNLLELLTAPWQSDCYTDDFGGLMWQILRSVVTGSVGEAVHFYGQPLTGKSVFVDLCAAVVGKKYSRRLSLSDAVNRFGMSGIVGAKLLYDAEMGGRKFLESDNVKRLITGDTLTIEDKYKSPFSYRNRALWIMAGNTGSMSSFDDKSTGIATRFIHVPFTHKMQDCRDSGVLEFLTSEPCLEWMLFHILHDVEPFKKFDRPPSVLQADAEVAEEMGVMPGFVRWFTDTPAYMARMAKAMFIPRDWIYDRYLLYTQESSPHSKTVMSLNAFMRALEPYLDPRQWQIACDSQYRVPQRFWQLESAQRVRYSSARVEMLGTPEKYYLRGRHRGLVRVDEANLAFSPDDVMLRFNDDPKHEQSLHSCMSGSSLDGFFGALYRDDVKVELVSKVPLPDAFLRRLVFPLGERSYEQKTRVVYVNGAGRTFTLERPQ